MANATKYKVVSHTSMENLESVRIAAISHIFFIDPRNLQFLEVKCNKKSYFVAIPEKNIHQVPKNIIIGAKYDITNLTLKQIRYCSDDSDFVVYMTTSKSAFVHLESVKVKSPHNLSNLINYKGVVTGEICAKLRIYELDDGVELHIRYLIHQAKVTLPQVGQIVCVYDAHCEMHDTKRCLVLCGRGYIKVLDERECTELSRNRLPRVSNIIYSSTYWLKKQLSSFQHKFTNDFLKANNIKSSAITTEFLNDSLLELLEKCIKVHQSNNVGKSRSVSKEFMVYPHYCGILDNGDKYPNYKTLQEFCYGCSNTENLWSFHSRQSEGDTVGVLTASVDSGYWVLSDATKSISCLITGSVDDSLHGAIVLLTKCLFFVEFFKFGRTECYIHVAMEHIKVIQAPGVQQETRVENERKKLKGADIAKRRESGEEELDLFHRPVVIAKDRSWQMLVLHRTSTVKTSKGTFCCLLVSLMRETSENRDGMSNRTERHYLLLDEKLVQYAPLIHNNMMYKVVFPHADMTSSCKVWLKQICLELPDVMGFRLNENCVICSMESTDFAFLNSIPDCYSVGKKELYEDLEIKELINIEGVICDRFHIDSKFNKEKKVAIIPGFGVSDGKTVVLKLYDPSLNSERVVCLYLNEWHYRSYPLGLVPGTRIQALFVTMVKSQGSQNVYFKVTRLTRLHVVEMAGSDTITTEPVARPSGPSCILTQEASKAAPGNRLWGLIRGTKILKFTASVSCTKCNMFFKRGVCTGCTSFPPSPKLTASAKCYIADVAGKVIIFINGDLLLTFFGLSQDYWNVIAKLVGLDGREITLPETQQNNEDPPGKKLLQELVDVSNKKKTHFYVFCRKMKTTTSNGQDKVPVLYCLDIKVPEAYLLYGSLENSSH